MKLLKARRLTSDHCTFLHALDAVDPLVFLLGCWGRDAVHHVIPFHHPSVSLRLTRFDQLTAVVWNVQLETVLGH